MPKNKDALFRYLCIDVRLRKEVKPSLNDLKSFIENEYNSLGDEVVYSVSTETLKKDIKSLRDDFGSPIDYDRANNTYFYQSENYSFLSLGVNTVRKLLTNIKLSRFLTDFNNANNYIQFETETSQLGWELIPMLIESIISNKRISILYKSVKGVEKKQTLSPYLLKENRNSWYLIASKEGKNEVRTFALSRIQKAEQLEQTSVEPPKSFDPKNYFNNSIGVTSLDGEKIEVELSFNPNQSQYLKEKPLHSSQLILIDDSFEFRIKLEVAYNYELMANILSYGEKVKVIKPDFLKRQVIEKIKIAMDQYKDR